MRLIPCVVALLMFVPSFAGYDANCYGVVTNVLTYQSGAIFVRLANQPQSHPQCLTDYFAIDAYVRGPDDIGK